MMTAMSPQPDEAELKPLPHGKIHTHVPALDGARGVAILLVLLLHTWVLYDTGYSPSSWLGRGYQSLMYAGWMGVDLFFVLSGFLITGILNSTRERHRYFYNFYGRRSLRIFPLYYAFLLVIGLMLPLMRHVVGNADKQHISGWYFLYLQNYIIAFRQGGWRAGSMIDISWSLAIEEQFYIVWPLLIWLFSRKPMMWICGLLVVTVPILRGVLLHRGVAPLAIYVMTPTRLDGLAMGSWIALAFAGNWSAVRMKTIGYCFASAALVAFVVIIAVHGDFSEQDPFVQTYGYSAVIFFFAAIIIAAAIPASDNAIVSILSNRVLRFFGRYSYALYLFHLPILGFVRDVFFRRMIHSFTGSLYIPARIGFQITVMGLSVFAALISWNLFEKQFLSLKHYFQDQPKPAKPA